VNYTSLIVKIINKPRYTLCEQKIPYIEVLGKFYQFRPNSQTLCKLSIWGKSAYEIFKYSKTHDYLIVEGYLSSSKSTFKKLDITTNIEISVFKVYPFSLNIKDIKK